MESIDLSDLWGIVYAGSVGIIRAWHHLRVRIRPADGRVGEVLDVRPKLFRHIHGLRDQRAREVRMQPAREQLLISQLLFLKNFWEDFWESCLWGAKLLPGRRLPATVRSERRPPVRGPLWAGAVLYLKWRFPTENVDFMLKNWWFYNKIGAAERPQRVPWRLLVHPFHPGDGI